VTCVGALLGLAAAAAFGVSDYLAGVAARRLHFLWVALVGALAGLVCSTAALAWQHGEGASATALGWGGVGGVGTAAGTLALYRGYGHGQMAVAGPLSAVGAAALPAVIGAALGDRLPPLAVVGVALALPGIWLMSRSPGDGQGIARVGVVDGLAAGAGFALLFVAFSQAGDSAGLWPVVAGMLVTSLLLGIGTVAARPASPRARETWPIIGLAGLLGVTGDALYLVATHHALLAVAAVLASLYPGITIAMAAVWLGERPDGRQVTGLLIGAVAVGAIVTGS
jgi:drug/metabolite transporter (DMT)-like permease